MYSPGHAAVNGNDRTDRLAEKNKHHKLLASRKSSSVEKLQTLPADTKPRTSHMDRLEERGVGRGSTRWSSLKGRDKALVYQTNVAAVSKATLGERLRRDGMARVWVFRIA